jgi:hypothetical protein
MSTNLGLVIFGDHSMVVEVFSLLQQHQIVVAWNNAMDVEDPDTSDSMDEELEAMVF